MAAPILSIVNATTETSVLNLTALTSEGGAWALKQGSTGSDWIYPNQYGQNSTVSGGDNYKRKLNGDDQIQFRRFMQLTDPDASTWMQPDTQPNGQIVTYDNADISEGFGPSTFNQMFRIVLIGAQCPVGLRFSMPADQKLRKFRWYGYTNGFGPSTFVVTASLSDGSLPPASLVMNRSGIFSDFSVAFRSVQQAILTVEIAHTVGSGPNDDDYSFLGTRAALLEKAIPAPKPRGFHNVFPYVGSYGGPNA